MAVVVRKSSIPATEVGQVLISVDGLTFSAHLPLTTLIDGWLINNDGIMLVVG